MKRIGILGLQGGFELHAKMVQKVAAKAIDVRLPKDLDAVDALIIPGGESTTIGLLLKESGLDSAIVRRAKKGMPIFGTCAGAIVLAKRIEGSNQPTLGLIDIKVKRNSYGRQIDSFEAPIEVEGVGKVNGVFIRAPAILSMGRNVRALARYGNEAVLVQEGGLLAATFHPELAHDWSIHRYFIEEVCQKS